MTIAHRVRQTTLRSATTLSGIGVHSGREVSLTLHPAEANTGVTFVAANGSSHRIPANFRHVSATDLCTAVAVPGASVATVEHLLAALSALGIDNATVEIDGPEVPIMDGSAAQFVDAVDQAGVERLDEALRYIRVLQPVRVEDGSSVAEFTPYNGRRIEVEIDFANPLVGRQKFSCDVDSASFRQDIGRARTFGFLADVEKMLARGLGRGASLENAVVVGDDRVLNPEGLRWSDEFVRHKLLDAIGDLALAGLPILGRYRSYRGGHRLNVMALQALLSDETAWEVYEVPAPRREPVPELRPLGLGANLGVAFAPEAS